MYFNTCFTNSYGKINEFLFLNFLIFSPPAAIETDRSTRNGALQSCPPSDAVVAWIFTLFVYGFTV